MSTSDNKIKLKSNPKYEIQTRPYTSSEYKRLKDSMKELGQEQPIIIDEDGYILDGFPRTVPQAEKFVNGINAVFYLKVSDKEALWRLAGRDDGDTRGDNTLTAIMKRINLFHEKTEPVIVYYRQKGVLQDIDGEKTIDEINKEILEKLDTSGKTTE